MMRRIFQGLVFFTLIFNFSSMVFAEKPQDQCEYKSNPDAFVYEKLAFNTFARKIIAEFNKKYPDLKMRLDRVGHEGIEEWSRGRDATYWLKFDPSITTDTIPFKLRQFGYTDDPFHFSYAPEFNPAGQFTGTCGYSYALKANIVNYLENMETNEGIATLYIEESKNAPSHIYKVKLPQ